MKRLLLVLFLSAIPFSVFAQSATTPAPTPDTAPVTSAAQAPVADTALGKDIVSCFDYYHFGSVQAAITASVSGTVSGTPITFSGSLKNANPYPIVDGALYVKVFKKRSTEKDVNGPDVVDQFLVKGDIVIPAGGATPITFSWRVPAYAESGDYEIATFFTTSRKFNLLGLSFTDDVVGNTVPFTVSGEQATAVRFDKAGVTVAGQPYRFAAFPPRLSATSSVDIVATVRNTTDTDQRAKISWTVYQWDAQLRENAVQEIPATTIMVPARGSVPATVTVSDARYPVYLAIGTLQWGDSKSVIGVRFVRGGIDKTRINFPGVVSYPLKAGQENTIFSCLHNAGTSASVPDGRLDLTLSDMQGRVIHQYSYTGAVTGAMMGVAEKFTPMRDYDRFVLDARLYRGNDFVDEAHLVYDCGALDPADCSPETPDALGSASSISDLVAAYGLTALAAAVALVLVVLFVGIRLLRKKPAVATI